MTNFQAFLMFCDRHPVGVFTVLIFFMLALSDKWSRKS